MRKTPLRQHPVSHRSLRDAGFSGIGRERGFTYVELLVVIAIVAVLMGLLLPILAKLRYQSQVTHCASNLGQISSALNAYAIANEGRFPDLDVPATGGNLWDVSHFFCDSLAAMGIRITTFICPLMEDPSVALSNFNAYSYFNIIEYTIWIPRQNGPDVIPPPPNVVGSRFVIAQPIPASPFAAPAKLSEIARLNNPIICDIVTSPGPTPASNADASAAKNPYNIAMSHAISGRLMGTNQGFADGHVELHGVESLKPYYYGNYWNWR